MTKNIIRELRDEMNVVGASIMKEKLKAGKANYKLIREWQENYDNLHSKLRLQLNKNKI